MSNVLVIAGLDPSGGAGLVADVRLCERLGARPLAVATALTVQTTEGVAASHPVDAAVIEAQLDALLADVEVAAVKIGMLGSPAVAAAVARALAATAAPVVWDPVGHATRGVALFAGELREAADVLAPRAALVTPNADEATRLTGVAIVEADDAVAAGRLLCARGAGAVLVKGGHWGPAATAIDVLVTAGDAIAIEGPRLAVDGPVHGTGCALATAIACNLAAGRTLEGACRHAKATIAAMIASPLRPGRGRAAVL